MQRLAGAEDEVIEVAQAIEECLHLRLIREIGDLALRPAAQRRESALDALPAARDLHATAAPSRSAAKVRAFLDFVVSSVH